MHITILGLVHELQIPGQQVFSTNDMPLAEARDKARVRAILEGLVANGAALIAEEWQPPPHSIPREVASALKVEHHYVDMPIAERRRRGIPDWYVTDESLSPAQRNEYHRQREAYMVEQLMRVAKSSAPAVMVCGSNHVAGVTHELESKGHEVTTVLLDQSCGFELSWLDDALGE